MKSIPLIDLSRQYQRIRLKINTAVLKTIHNQEFILGREVEAFEKQFARFCGKKFAVGLGSGTDALYASLLAMGIEPGDEVVIPVFTFIATAEVVSLLGGKVVFCDIDSTTGLMDVRSLRKCLTNRTAFIIPVHLYGQIAPMDEIQKLADQSGARIIEDAAQAHGALYKKKASPITRMAAYSFYPAKNLGAYGDAGAIVTNNRKLYERIMLLRNHGQKKGEKYRHLIIGSNLRMDAIQAAVLSVKLRYLRQWIARRRQLAAYYDQKLAKIKGILPITRMSNNLPSYHLYCIRARARDALQAYLLRKGIETRVHYPIPLHLQPGYRHLGYKPGDFPKAEKLASEALCLPMFPELTLREISFICQTIANFYLTKH